MKIMKLYILPIFLVIASIVAVAKGTDTMKEVAVLSAQDTVYAEVLRQLKPGKQLSANSLSTPEAMTFKQLLEMLATKHDVPVSVTIAQGQIRVAGDQAVSKDILKKYESVMAFVAAMSGLPYSMEYKTFCLGEACPASFEVVLQVSR